VEDDKPGKSNLGRCLGLGPAGDIARSPVSLSFSFSFSLSFTRSRLILFLKNPLFSFSCPPILLGDRPNDPNTEVRGGDVEFVGTDGDDGVGSELPNEVGHRVTSEGVNRLIAEIDDEGLTSPLVLVLTTVGNRAFDAGEDGDEGGGDGDGTRVGGNAQCEGKDVFVAEAITSDSICKICSFVKIGFPKANWFSSFDVTESYR
jgi:hypothetical protein